jgi:alkylation response protein AidB-like acyl-CoA dehydrogenase
MDLRDTPAEAFFRARLRAWLAENLPVEPEPAALAERWPYMRDFQRRLYQGGWVALSYPTEVGGQGLGPMEEAILSQELGRADAPSMLPIGHLGRPLLSHGTTEQRTRYLSRRTRSGVRASPSREPGPTWRPCAPGPSATAGTG